MMDFETKTFAGQTNISLMSLVAHNWNVDELVHYHLETLMHKGAISIFKEIYSCGHPVVVETHLESWTDPTMDRMCYRLHYRLTAVRSRKIELPVFEFVDHAGKVEWKCSYCSMINSIDATYCGEKHEHAVGCGHPREATNS